MPARPYARLLLIRHGSVASEWAQRIYGSLDVPLSAAGRSESLELARALDDLHLDRIISSGLSRADFLAQACASGRDLAHATEPRLREIDRGRWAGLDAAGVEADTPGGWAAFRAAGGAYVPPGGEGFESLGLRVRDALDEVARTPGVERALLVAHRFTWTAALCHTLALDWRSGARIELPPLALIVLDWPRSEGPTPRLCALRPSLADLRRIYAVS